MTKGTFAKASKVVNKPLNVKIDICLCTNKNMIMYTLIMLLHDTVATFQANTHYQRNDTE